MIKIVLRINGFSPERLIVEFTESVALRDVAQILGVIEDLKLLSVGVAIDNVAVGSSRSRISSSGIRNSLKSTKLPFVRRTKALVTTLFRNHPFAGQSVGHHRARRRYRDSEPVGTVSRPQLRTRAGIFPVRHGPRRGSGGDVGPLSRKRLKYADLRRYWLGSLSITDDAPAVRSNCGSNPKSVNTK